MYGTDLFASVHFSRIFLRPECSLSMTIDHFNEKNQDQQHLRGYHEACLEEKQNKHKKHPFLISAKMKMYVVFALLVVMVMINTSMASGDGQLISGQSNNYPTWQNLQFLNRRVKFLPVISPTFATWEPQLPA